MADLSVALRRAGPADATAIRDLTRAVYAKWIPVIGREPKPMMMDYAKAVQAHWIDLYEEDGCLVALIEMIPRPDHLFIENIAVAESAQGQGLAKALLRHADDVARGAGLPQLRLGTNKAFATNVAMYRHLGFVLEREEAFPLGGIGVWFQRPVSDSA